MRGADLVADMAAVLCEVLVQVVPKRDSSGHLAFNEAPVGRLGDERWLGVSPAAVQSGDEPLRAFAFERIITFPDGFAVGAHVIGKRQERGNKLDARPTN